MASRGTGQDLAGKGASADHAASILAARRRIICPNGKRDRETKAGHAWQAPGGFAARLTFNAGPALSAPHFTFMSSSKAIGIDFGGTSVKSAVAQEGQI